jgi:hypothetical protein
MVEASEPFSSLRSRELLQVARFVAMDGNPEYRRKGTDPPRLRASDIFRELIARDARRVLPSVAQPRTGLWAGLWPDLGRSKKIHQIVASHHGGWGVHPCAVGANFAANSANSSFRFFEALAPACRRAWRYFWFRTFSFSRLSAASLSRPVWQVAMR